MEHQDLPIVEHHPCLEIPYVSYLLWEFYHHHHKLKLQPYRCLMRWKAICILKDDIMLIFFVKELIFSNIIGIFSETYSLQLNFTNDEYFRRHFWDTKFHDYVIRLSIFNRVPICLRASHFL